MTAARAAGLLSIPVVADRLGISRTSVYDLIARGDLGDVVDVGTATRSRVRVTEAGLAACIERRTHRARRGRAA
ncbi:helix-turn-helix transcriptional regulator [Embleya sp. NPDC059237]|uniref:helix-turn-helix transcriptional regulator n=1 Tax=Embleya sp. NPDC059237 TaxID=3346784 RepID=UPI0036C50A17